MTNTDTHTTPEATPLPEIMMLEVSDLRYALAQGVADFRAAPLFGIVFASFYVICGASLRLLGADLFTWTIVLSLGFPLVAPFAAVGLYEVSRRLEAGEPLMWGEVFGVIWAERGRQLPWMGMILMIIFMFWSFFAHMSLALFLGNMDLVNVMSSTRLFETFNGASLVAFEVAVGAAVALLTFALTFVAMPLLLDREIDFVTAMLISLRAFGQNLWVLLIWAVIIGVGIIAAMLPYFLGLLVTLPILGHATWHIYRRCLSFE